MARFLNVFTRRTICSVSRNGDGEAVGIARADADDDGAERKEGRSAVECDIAKDKETGVRAEGEAIARKPQSKAC